MLESPVADRGGGLGDREHFSVSSRIFALFNSIVGGRDDFAATLDYAANGDLILSPGVDRLVEGEAHKKLIITHQLGRKPLFEWAGNGGVGGGRH